MSAEPSKLCNALGVISGTSMDGIDVALIATDGTAVLPGKGGTYPYPVALRDALLAVIDPQRAEEAPLDEIEAAPSRAPMARRSRDFLARPSLPSTPDRRTPSLTMSCAGGVASPATSTDEWRRPATPHQGMVEAFMQHPYFRRPSPKSLDRNEFHASAVAVEHLSDADGAATLAEFSVRATAEALRHVPRQPLRLLVAGGGRHNAHLMRRLAAALPIAVAPVEAVGWDGDFLEAQCFAYLAVRSLRGLPISLPTTTGHAPQPVARSASRRHAQQARRSSAPGCAECIESFACTCCCR